MSTTEKLLSNREVQTIGIDAHNVLITGKVSMTLLNGRHDTHNIPVVLVENRGGYCYRKTAHPRNSQEPQGYEETEIADTLNIFDYTEARTPILVVEVRNGERTDRP